MVRRALLLALVPTALLVAPGGVAAQRDCNPAGTQSARGAGTVIYLMGARLQCADMRIRADSATLHQDSRVYQLFGRVVIDNPEVRLEGRTATYYPDQGLVMAQGAVRILRKADSTAVSGGEDLVLYRAGVGRPEDALTVSGGRPHAVMRPARPEGAAPDTTAAEPYVIDADRIEVTGQDLSARGRVELRRGDLDARADTLGYLSDSGQLLLRGSASLDVDTHQLTGGLIVVTIADDQIQDILARRSARLTGDLELEAGFIQLELSGGELESLAAGPDAEAAPRPGAAGPPLPSAMDSTGVPRQATALSEDFSITADRLDIELTAGVLERLDARGRARLVTTSGDSLNASDTPDIARSDWLEGDTINVLFAAADSASPAGVDSLVARIDSAAAPLDLEAEPESANAPAPRLEMLIARINARALYRLPPADTSAARDPACAGPGRFAVHYVLGDSITITMKDSEVDEMNVVGQVEGQHLEPPPCVPAQPADSAASTPPPGGGGQPQPAPAGGPPPPPPSGAAGEDATPPRGESLPRDPRTRSPSRRARPEPAVRR